MSAPRLQAGTIFATHYALVSLAVVSGAPEAWAVTLEGSGQELALLYYPGDVLGPVATQHLVVHGNELVDLRHARLGAVLALGVDESGGAYAVIPWCGEDTAQRRLERQGAFNLHVAAGIVEDVLAGLAALHSRSLVHRAVSAVDTALYVGADGLLRARLLPGGLLAELGREGALRAGAASVPPPSGGEYAAPEQWAGLDATAASDVWASAVLLHRLASGAWPFPGATLEARRAAAAQGALDLAPELPRAVAEVLRLALTPRPQGRWPDADSMRAALSAAFEDGAHFRPVDSSARALRPTSRPAGAGGDDDGFDLDDLVSSIKSRTKTPPPMSVGPAAKTQVHGSGPPPALSSSAAPRPPDGDGAAAEAFNLDSMPAPALPQRAPVAKVPAGNLAALGRAVDATSAYRESATHTALEAKAIDRTKAVVLARRRGLSAAGGLTLVLAATGAAGWAGWHWWTGRAVAVHVERVRPLEAEPSHPTATTTESATPGAPPAAPAWTPQVEAQSAVDYGEQLHVDLPAGLDGVAQQAFVGHVTTAPAGSRAHLAGFASCTEGRVFVHPGGVSGRLVQADVPARCESRDVMIAPDLDGDGAADAVAVDTRRSGLIVVGSRRGSQLRRIGLPGAWALTGPIALQVRGRPEPGAVVFVSSEAGAPSLVGVGLHSGRVVWRLPSTLRPAEPADFGLTICGDVDGDAVDDVAMGMLRDGRRCVMVLSGATGAPRWEAPYCRPGTATQTVAAGPDLDDDGAADVMVSSGADTHVRIVSGRTGRELSRVEPQGPEPTVGFGFGALFAPDLAHDGFPDVVVTRATVPDATMEVYSANDGHRSGRFPLHGAGGAVVESVRVRLQFARDFVFPGSLSVLVASPVGIFVVGAAPRPEGV